MLSFAEKIKEELHAEVRELNLGGGFGIKYVDGDEFKAYGLYIEEVSKVVKRLCEEKKLLQPKILYEPGRAIVGAAGITLYTVGSVKEIKNIRTYVSVDGGMTDNPRFALYEAEYTMDIANKMNNPKETFVTVAGRCCESGDLLGKDIPLQKAEKGDILAVYSTGAYNYSMASNYNRTLRPAMVFIKEGEDILALKRETFEDLTKNDL